MLTDPLPAGGSLIRVALVEDDVSFQRAVLAAIDAAPDMSMLGIAATRAQGMLLLDQQPADVLLVDLGLPDGSGIDVIRSAHVRWPECNIMVCTVFGDESHVMQSIGAGASGYLLKDTSPTGMLAEIRSLHRGGSPISPLVARQILVRFQQSGESASAVQDDADGSKQPAALSPREKLVLQYITKGFTSDEIAGLMSVSRHTVLTYVRRIYSKLEVKSKAEAIYEARIQGLLP